MAEMSPFYDRDHVFDERKLVDLEAAADVAAQSASWWTEARDIWLNSNTSYTAASTYAANSGAFVGGSGQRVGFYGTAPVPARPVFHLDVPSPAMDTLVQRCERCDAYVPTTFVAIDRKVRWNEDSTWRVTDGRPVALPYDLVDTYRCESRGHSIHTPRDPAPLPGSAPGA